MAIKTVTNISKTTVINSHIISHTNVDATPTEFLFKNHTLSYAHGHSPLVQQINNCIPFSLIHIFINDAIYHVTSTLTLKNYSVFCLTSTYSLIDSR